MLKDRIEKLFEWDPIMKFNEEPAPFKIGDKVVMQVGSPISARFKGIGEVVKIEAMPNISGGYEIYVKDRDGEITKTHDNFIKLSSTNITHPAKTEGTGPADGNSGDSQSMAGSMTYESKEIDDLWGKFDKEFDVKKDKKTGRVIPPKQKRK